MAGVIAFTSAAKRHTEKITTLSFTPTTSATLLTSGALTSIKPYPYLRAILLHVYPSVAGSSGGTLAADAPWNILQSIMVSDTNGTAIYGSPSFSGYDAMLVHYLGGYRGGATDPQLYPLHSAAADKPEFLLRVPFEYNPRTGAGSLPNMSSAATYNLTIYGNTLANIYTTAPTTTTPTIGVDVHLECWTLPDAQDLLGRNQMQGPPFLGTTQYVTKQSFTGLTASGNNTLTLTRKGNLIRKWIQVGRNSSVARIAAAGAAGTGPGGGWAPNPYEFWWDANRLTSDDPQIIRARMVENLPGGQEVSATSTGQLVTPTGVLCYDFSDQYGENKGSDGEGGWLATTQSARLEFQGATWGGSSFAQVDHITIDVAPIALANQYQLDSATGKLMYPAQPETRG